MSRAMFTAEELAELAAFDAEIDAEPLTMEEIRQSRARDRAAVLEGMDPRTARIAAQKAEYRAANRERIAAYQAEYRERKRAEKDALQAGD